MVGASTSLAGLSIAVPNSPSHGPAPYRFDITFNPDTGDSELKLKRDQPGLEPAVLAKWRGSSGRFYYLDEAGNWQERWPVSTPSAPVAPGRRESPLPKAVELRYGDPPQSLIVAIQDRSIPLPPISELMK